MVAAAREVETEAADSAATTAVVGTVTAVAGTVTAAAARARQREAEERARPTAAVARARRRAAAATGRQRAAAAEKVVESRAAAARAGRAESRAERAEKAAGGAESRAERAERAAAVSGRTRSASCWCMSCHPTFYLGTCARKTAMNRICCWARLTASSCAWRCTRAPTQNNILFWRKD